MGNFSPHPVTEAQYTSLRAPCSRKQMSLWWRVDGYCWMMGVR